MKGRKPTPLEIRRIINDKDGAKISRALEEQEKLENIPSEISFEQGGGEFLTLEDLGITCPSFLGEEAKKVWDGLTSELGSFRLLKTVDVHLLARYCDCFIKWKESKDFIEKHGVKYPIYTEEYFKEFDEEKGRFVSKKKRTLKSWHMYPEYRIYADMADKLLRLEQELGMTPIGRTKIAIAIVNSKNNDPNNRALAGKTISMKPESVDPFAYDE